MVTLLLNCVVIVVGWCQSAQSVASGADDDKLARMILIPAAVVAQILIIANVLGLISAYAPAFYYTVIVLGLCQAALFFLRLVDSLFSREAGE